MSAVLQFSRPMKRATKVRRGPCAQIIQFSVPLASAELRAEWCWLSTHHSNWADDRLPTADDLAAIGAEKIERRIAFQEGLRSAFGKKSLTEAGMRQDIAKWRAQINKRRQVKDWLEHCGIDLSDALEPERALLFAFDRMTAREMPTSA